MSAPCNNRELIERFSALVMAGDMENAAALVQTDFVLTEDDGLPYGGKWHGFDGLLRLLGTMADTWADLAIETRSIIGEPDGNEFGLLMQIAGKLLSPAKPSPQPHSNTGSFVTARSRKYRRITGTRRHFRRCTARPENHKRTPKWPNTALPICST